MGFITSGGYHGCCARPCIARRQLGDIGFVTNNRVVPDLLPPFRRVLTSKTIMPFRGGTIVP
jgi:hypothetical protein